MPLVGRDLAAHQAFDQALRSREVCAHDHLEQRRGRVGHLPVKAQQTLTNMATDPLWPPFGIALADLDRGKEQQRGRALDGGELRLVGALGGACKTAVAQLITKMAVNTITQLQVAGKIHVQRRLVWATRLVFSSASSKTAYGTAVCLQDEAIERVALTSAHNVPFVQQLDCYDKAVSYDHLHSLTNGGQRHRADCHPAADERRLRLFCAVRPSRRTH